MGEEGVRIRLCGGDRSAPAFGVAISYEALARRADALAKTAARRTGLRLSLGPDLAIFWSLSAPEPPWFPEPLFYLGPPRGRIFAPVGRRLDAPDLVLEALQRRLVGAGLEAPFLAAPSLAALSAGAPVAEDGAEAAYIGLGGGAAAADVDWAALAQRGRAS